MPYSLMRWRLRHGLRCGTVACRGVVRGTDWIVPTCGMFPGGSSRRSLRRRTTRAAGNSAAGAGVRPLVMPLRSGSPTADLA